MDISTMGLFYQIHNINFKYIYLLVFRVSRLRLKFTSFKLMLYVYINLTKSFLHAIVLNLTDRVHY